MTLTLTLKDLRGKSILVNDTEELNNILMYMELNGVLWMNGNRPTQDNEDLSVPILLNLDSDEELTYTDYWDYQNNGIGLFLNMNVVNYKDLNLNWYKVFHSQDNTTEIYLYHIPTNKILVLNGFWVGNILHGRFSSNGSLITGFDVLKLSEDNHKLTLSDEVKLYQDRNNNTLSIGYVEKNSIFQITKNGFQLLNYNFPSPYMREIDEVTFKKVN